MLAKQYRLPSSTDFTSSRSWQTPSFSMKIQNNKLSYNRFGFVVSKQVDKRAVVRNQLKRKFRSCIEEVFSSLKEGHDVLFVLRKSLLNTQRSDMLEAIKHGLVKQGIM